MCIRDSHGLVLLRVLELLLAFALIQGLLEWLIITRSHVIELLGGEAEVRVGRGVRVPPRE